MSCKQCVKDRIKFLEKIEEVLLRKKRSGKERVMIYGPPKKVWGTDKIIWSRKPKYKLKELRDQIDDLKRSIGIKTPNRSQEQADSTPDESQDV